MGPDLRAGEFLVRNQFLSVIQATRLGQRGCELLEPRPHIV